jgi:hypothetical protein
MKNLICFVLYLLLVGGVHAQSNLPACQDSYPSKWSNCIGAITLANGDKYFGEWFNGTLNGQGIYTFNNGAKHFGEYKDGKQHGQGTYIFESGDTYVGEYREGKKNGLGTYTFTNRNKYVGEYKDDRRTGQGTFTFADGRVGLGEWKDGKPHGRMIEYQADKSISRSGIYEDGKFIREEIINPVVFTRIAPKK